VNLAAKPTLRVATWNIHKGVRGLGPLKRLEIHGIAEHLPELRADLVFLQEVRAVHRRDALRFAGWPRLSQAEFLAAKGYFAAYQTNAVTRHGEHGNALLSRWPILRHQHEDMSDHRLEQRGLLHVELDTGPERVGHLHAIVVHLGLIPASRTRQLAQLMAYMARHIPEQAPVVVAGDFNDWGLKQRQALALAGLFECESHADSKGLTFPAALPLLAYDHIYARGLKPETVEVPRGRPWSRLSDHLPLIANLR
jgi:endonuclease/exonuclease/phosphatase family metal-dependent hydrolase